MYTPKSRFVIGSVVLLICLAPVTATVAGSQQSVPANPQQQAANYSVSVEMPGDVTTGTQTVAVTISNTGSTDLLNPIIEVPLTGNINATASDAANATAEVDGANRTVDAEINTSTLTGGEAMFVFGRQVPAGEERTYYFTVDVTAAGSTSITAETRPLYNEDLAVNTSTTVQAKGYGNVTAEVIQNGSPVSSATVIVDGEEYDGGTTGQLEKVEGIYNLSVSGISGFSPELNNISLAVQENKQVTFTVPSTISDPTVVATTASASVIPVSISEVDTPGSATTNRENKIQYTIETNAGKSGFTQPISDDLQPLKTVEITTDNNSELLSMDRSSSVLNYTLSSTSNSDVTVTLTGYKLGDETGDGTVNTDDANSIATSLANQNADSLTPYSDVNGDGKITAADAMYIAQYDSGNRTESYTRGGSE